MKKQKTFAQRAKEIEKKFEGRNDQISTRTKKALMQKLREEQELIKSQMGDSDNQNQAMFGNLFNNAENPAPSAGNSAGGPGVGGYMGAASGALELGNMAFGKTGIDTSGRTAAPEVKTQGGAAIGGAMKGAQAGMAFGPWGAAIGGVLGGAAGLIGGGKAKKEAAKASMNFDLAQSNKYKPNDYALGGIVDPIDPMKNPLGPVRNETSTLDSTSEERDMYRNNLHDKNEGFNYGKYAGLNYFNATAPSQGGTVTLSNSKDYPHNYDALKNSLNEIRKVNPGIDVQGKWNNYSMGGKVNKYVQGGPMFGDTSNITDPEAWKNVDFNKGNTGLFSNVEQSTAGKALSKTGEFLKNNYGDILSYAPVVGELFNKIKKPTTARGNRLEGRSSLPRVDEKRLLNQINDNAVFSGVKEASAGNLGALMAGNLAGELNKTKAKGDAFAKTFAINAGQKEKEVKLDRQADMFNAMQEERYIERKAKDEGAYNTAKDAKRASIINSLGDIGREESNKKLVKEMFGYTWNGKYFVDKKGNKVSEADVAANIRNTNETKQKMFGGYLKK